MKLSPLAATLALTSRVVAEADTIVQITETIINYNPPQVFAPALAPAIDTHSLTYIIPQTNVSLFYGSNVTETASIRVNHTMRYPLFSWSNRFSHQCRLLQYKRGGYFQQYRCV